MFFQAEDGIRDLVRSRGLGDVYKRQRYDGVHRVIRAIDASTFVIDATDINGSLGGTVSKYYERYALYASCLLYTSDAADERSSVDLGGRRIIKNKNKRKKNKKQQKN